VESAFAEAHDQYATRIAGKSRLLSPEDRAFIDQHADRRLWRQVTALAV
jgi:hypothetical protein